MKSVILWLLYTLLGFLSGSVMYCGIIPKLLCGIDVAAESPDRNPGSANVFLHCGVGVGLLCLILDIFKGFLPVFLAQRVLSVENIWFSLLIAAPVAGHALGMFNEFHGGKCIATSFGVLLAVAHTTMIWLLLAGLYILFSTVIKIHPNSRRSIVTYAFFAVLALLSSFLWGHFPIMIGCCLISVMVIIRHLKAPDI